MGRLAATWLLGACLAGCAGLGAGPGPTAQALYGLALPRAGGGQVRFAEHRGQVLLVDLFVTWSQASLAATAGYDVLLGRYAERGLAVVGVALDEIPAVVEPFARGMQLTYPVALADPAVREGRSPLGAPDPLPRLLVFDREGRLRGAFLGLVKMQQVEALILELL